MSPVNGTRRALVRALATLALTAGAMLGVLSASAQAKQITATVSPAPVQGLASTVTFTGTAPAGADSTLTAVARPAGGGACKATPPADAASAPPTTQPLVSASAVAPGDYSVPATWTPADEGKYIVCAWLQQPTKNTTTTTGPVTTPVHVQHPQATVKVALSPGRVAGTAFTVSFATQSDQPLTLFATVRQSAGGCAASHEAESSKPGTANLFPGGFAIPAGAGSAAAQPTLPAGRWLVCAYLQGPIAGEVVNSQAVSFNVAKKPAPPAGRADPTLALTSATATTTTGIALTGTTAPTFFGPLTVKLQCGLVTVKVKITAAAGAFSATSGLPSGCVPGDVVQIQVISRLRKHFKASEVAASATVTAPAVVVHHHPRRLPRLFRVVRRHGAGVTNVFRVRPRHVRVALSVGGPLTLHWSKWTRFGARGHGTAHPGHRRFAVHVHATHPTHGHFACLAVTARHHGRRHTTRLALARVPGTRPLAWGPVHRLGGPHSRYRAVSRQGCR
jgi:hypothetical protein